MHSAKRVLIVENDFLVGEKLRGMLEDEGHSVIGDTASGKQAIQMAAELRPDIVIMDIGLLEMDGLTAARHIMAQSPTPLVALTAHENPDLVAEASESGIGYYLVKPVSRRELARAIQIATARFEDLMELRRLNEDLQNEIAERKRAEEALRKSEAWLSKSQAIAHVGSWELDVVANRLTWSDEVYCIFGFRHQEFDATYEAFLDAVHPDDRAAVDAAYTDSLREGRESYEIDHRIVHQDSGEIRFVHEKCEHIKDNAGRVVRSIGIVQDITERKRAGEQLEHYAAELERSNRELEQFAYVISHDLREPARVVKSYLELLASHYRDELDEKADMYIDYAVDGAQRMQAMINGMLDLSRVETRGKDPARTDAQEVLERTLKSLNKVIEESGAEVTHDPLPKVMADEAQLSQVFQNLITNGIKFRRDDVPPRVHVSAEHKGNEWIFSVADNGIGIDPEYTDRIFQIFQRLHTREEYPGTGIGLAICKRVVERHGGSIWVDSEPDRGSTFYFTLPS